MSSDAADEPPHSESRISLVPPPPPPATQVYGERLLGLFEHLGVMTTMTLRTLRAYFKRPFEGKAIVTQIESLGVASLGIVTVTSVFIGMVMAVQFAFGLRKFGGMEYTGRVVGLSFARELAPTLTAVIVGGRIGAGMAAEVGSMAVTEQIDALRALGADPYKKLVLPRLTAAVIVMPVLAALALVLGFTGAMVITDLQFNIPGEFFLRSALGTVTMRDLVSGMFKTPFFGAIIALVGCHFGMTTRGGTAGVGNSTTRTVVVISITILIADFFLTKVSIALMPQL
ncbi:MAG: ABC transporter permease [Myxococcales bacterium]|nr:ABC transporter permease [Myxococcales bacterium]MCB9582059.1 ABC transporter permease [Polyangiaceae bacterium]